MNFILHRVVMGCEKGDGKIVDHINRDRLDNRKANLRIVPKWVNDKNREIPASSRFLGVCWEARTKRWTAWRYENNQSVFIGRYEFEVEAAYAVMLMRIERLLTRLEDQRAA